MKMPFLWRNRTSWNARLKKPIPRSLDQVLILTDLSSIKSKLEALENHSREQNNQLEKFQQLEQSWIQKDKDLESLISFKSSWDSTLDTRTRLETELQDLWSCKTKWNRLGRELTGLRTFKPIWDNDSEIRTSDKGWVGRAPRILEDLERRRACKKSKLGYSKLTKLHPMPIRLIFPRRFAIQPKEIKGWKRSWRRSSHVFQSKSSSNWKRTYESTMPRSFNFSGNAKKSIWIKRKMYNAPAKKHKLCRMKWLVFNSNSRLEYWILTSDRVPYRNLHLVWQVLIHLSLSDLMLWHTP